MIDIEKFICSLLAGHPEGAAVRSDIHKALKDQGLEYKDGKIVNIEPKFKIFDWVVYCHEDVDLITGIEENGYTIDEGGFIPFACEDSMQLWDITLAKDGDVLADGYDGDAIVLFKSIGNKNFNDVIDYYAYTSFVSGEFVVQKGGHYWGYTQNCTLAPATK